MFPEQVLSREDLLNLVESGKELASLVDPRVLLQNILERARHLTDSEGASILLEDERNGGLYFAAALGDTAAEVLAKYGEASKQRVPPNSKAGIVFLSGKSLVEESLERDRDHYKGVDRETGGTTRNMVCAAMAVNDSGSLKRLGVLQIINKKSGPYGERDRVLLEHFATQAAMAIRNTKLFSSLVAHMGFYAARDPLEIMEELKQPPRYEPLTAMFADMRGFTRLCQTIRSDAHVCDVLSEFITMLASEVLAHDGMVNKKLGDGILALFRRPDSPRRAVACAFSMEDRFRELRKRWASTVPEKIDFLDIGFGIVTAPVMLGAIGTGNMRDFTAIGTPVILAAALEKEARGGKRVLSDKETYFAVKDLVDEQVKPVDFPLHKPDQPTITSYDVYHLVRRQAAGSAGGSASSIKAFLCHASEDMPRVCDLYDRLRQDGIDAWLDKQDINAGEEWALVIPNAVRASDVVLVCISSRSISKEGYLQKELRCVLDVADEKPDGAVYVIPVRFEDCLIPQRLSRWQWVDLFEAEGYNKLIRSLRTRAAGARAATTR
jgi:class 3 adenylate cyclase